MRHGKHSGRDLLGLAILFVAFIAALLGFERVSQETVSRDTPSTLNAQGPGAKALFLLLEKEGFSLERMEAPWTTLRPSVALLTVIEPLDRSRRITAEEMKALKTWIEAGGTVLFMVTLPPRDLDKKDEIVGDLAIVRGDDQAKDLKPFEPDSPYVRSVDTLHIASPVRLRAGQNAHYHTLFRDDDGAMAMAKEMGKGHVVVLANSVAASNEAISKGDNAILLYNIAQEAVKNGGHTVAFDEYHHGVGFESHDGDGPGDASLFAAAPAPLRYLLLHLGALGILLLYTANRRFGPLQAMHSVAYRPSTDYMGSMARLFRRANSGDIVIATLYRQFLRDLRHRLDLSPDAPLQQLVAAAVRTYGVPEAPLLQLLTTCETIDRGQRITEATMLQLARELDNYRRSFNLVGIQ